MSAPAILFPPVLGAVIGYLDSKVDIPVRSRVPDPRPAAFIVVQRTGGPRDSMVTETAQITIESWASNDVDAEDMALLVRAHMQALGSSLVGGIQFHRVEEFGGPGYLPDPDSRQSRWTFTVGVQVRGQAIT